MSRFRIPIVVALLFVAASAVPAATSRRLALAPGDKAPKLTGRTLDQAPWRAEWNQNAATIVNFWATWCEPCKAEMPALQKLQVAHAGNGLQVVGVLMDPVPADELGAYLEPLAVTYPIVRPGPSVNADWGGIVVMPLTFLVDRDGRVVRRYVGATPEQVVGLARDVEAFLGGRPLETLVVPEAPNFVGDEERMRIQDEKEKQEKGDSGSR